MTYRITSQRGRRWESACGHAGVLPLLPLNCRKLPLSGKIMGGVFCGVVRDLTRGICLVSADVGCGVLVFVGFGGLVGRWNLEQDLPLRGQFRGKTPA